jgi:ankyrin repeat protein
VKPAAKLPTSLTYDQFTPLHRAAACGDALAVRDLLKKGADPNGRGYDDQTPLHLAARNKHQEVVKELLSQQHINLNPLEPSGHTPLMCAVESGATGVVGLLLETEGVDVDPISPTQRPLLQLAIEAGHIGTIERLLRDRRFDISCRWDYNSPLLASIRAGRDPVTLFVLSQGGLNDVRTPRGESALLLATRKGSLAVVKEILKDDKVDVDSTDHNGYNAFQWAVREGDLEMVQVLLANPRTNVRSVDSYGRSAFDIAEEYGNCRMAVLLNQHLDRTELGFRRTTQAHSSRGKCSYMMYCRR